jgi:hypothetical protein
MKQVVRSVPAILSLSIASLSLMALAGCGAAGSGAPTAAKSLYAIENSYNATNETFVSSLLVFSASATGSTTPTATLTLPSGFQAAAVVVGPQGQIYIGGALSAGDAGYGQILEYPAGASGAATPSVTLNSASSGTFTIPLYMAVNSAGTLVVASEDGSLEAFASGFTASSTPTQYLTWGVNNGTSSNFGDLGFATGIGVDTAGDIFCIDMGSGGIGGVVDVFAAGATGATAPARQITGTNTNSFDEIYEIAVDGAGDVYVANYNPFNDPLAGNGQSSPVTYPASKGLLAMGQHRASQSVARPLDNSDPTYEPTGIIEFSAGAANNATPLKRIGGATAPTNATNIVEPIGLAVDGSSNLYYADANGGFYSDANLSVLLEVFPPSATGNVAPAASITSTSYPYVQLPLPFLLEPLAVY